MDGTTYTDYIWRGHILYWDMLGNMRGNCNHKSDICWLSGDIHYSYSMILNGPEYENQVEQIINRIKNKEIPHNIVISSASAPADVDVMGYFMRTGLFRMGLRTLGMAKELNSETVFPKTEKCLNIYRVNDLWQLKMCGAILNAAFEYDLFSYEHYLDAFNMPDVSFYMAEYAGLPVGGCMSIMSEDFVDIAWVGTLNGYRKKGIAGHIIHAAEKEALQIGKTIAVLTAFEGGIHAYQRIGYVGNCKIDSLEFIGDEKT
jgi:GNAT superfamily N-acetyltransferase